MTEDWHTDRRTGRRVWDAGVEGKGGGGLEGGWVKTGWGVRA